MEKNFSTLRKMKKNENPTPEKNKKLKKNFRTLKITE